MGSGAAKQRPHHGLRIKSFHVVMMVMVVMMMMMVMVMMVMMIISRESGKGAESHRQRDDSGGSEGLEHGETFL
jgi:heme/copper-type cytochrome/quinol oxidase subunit 2